MTRTADEALDEACNLIVEISGMCPIDYLALSPRDHGCEERCEYGVEAKCWKDYLTGEGWDDVRTKGE